MCPCRQSTPISTRWPHNWRRNCHASPTPDGRGGSQYLQASRREKLTEIVRARKFDVQSEAVSEETGALRAITWRLKLAIGRCPPSISRKANPKRR